MTSARPSGDGSDFASCAAASADEVMTMATNNTTEEERRFMTSTWVRLGPARDRPHTLTPRTVYASPQPRWPPWRHRERVARDGRASPMPARSWGRDTFAREPRARWRLPCNAGPTLGSTPQALCAPVACVLRTHSARSWLARALLCRFGSPLRHVVASPMYQPP